MNNLEKFLSKNTIDGGFLQSEEWEKFQKENNKKVFSFFDDNQFRCLAIEHKLPLVGGYFFVPRGPVLKNQKPKTKNQNEYLSELIRVAEENKMGWVRIEPQTEKELEIIRESLESKYEIKKSKKNHEPAQTLILDLTKNEDEILMSMKSKTRYNIRLCQKNGVEIFESQSKDNLENFFRLVEETAKRNNVQFHPKEYYEEMMEIINRENLKLYLAKFNEEIIGSILVSFYGGAATYLHGASADKYRNKMAVYGLQWKVIREAKKQGIAKYDFGGISESTRKYPKIKEKWQGITRFKRGFLPEEKVTQFPGCWDIILNKNKYHLYRFIQKIKD